jgi:hypothetical protein
MAPGGRARGTGQLARSWSSPARYRSARTRCRLLSQRCQKPVESLPRSETRSSLLNVSVYRPSDTNHSDTTASPQHWRCEQRPQRRLACCDAVGPRCQEVHGRCCHARQNGSPRVSRQHADNAGADSVTTAAGHGGSQPIRRGGATDRDGPHVGPWNPPRSLRGDRCGRLGSLPPANALSCANAFRASRAHPSPG